MVFFTEDWQNFHWCLLEIANLLELDSLDILHRNLSQQSVGRIFLLLSCIADIQKCVGFAISRAKLFTFSGSNLSFCD